MQFFVGTSGFSYKEWKGGFYPEKLPAGEMLAYYAERFSTVEINNTFYRMPEPSVLELWASQVPKEFRFAIKAPQTITHRKRLNGVAEEVEALLDTTAVLGKRRGRLLFQLPPNFKKDLPRLEAFLQLIKGRAPLAFEFRHASWFDDETFACLRNASVSLCVADVDDAPSPDLISTAGWGYLRLRRKSYTAKALARWIERAASSGWKQAYVFFKHEDTGTGPKLASRFLKLAG
jgi:uncharacterized protein YecE (DUF72 family)